LASKPLALATAAMQASGRDFVDFRGLLEACWDHGIPVVFLADLPRSSKRITGMAIDLVGRPVIVLGHNSKTPAKQLFILAHELAHIACGHLKEGELLVDEDIVNVNEGLAGTATVRLDEEERQADAFALALLRNGHESPLRALGRIDSAAGLASAAYSASESLGIDVGHLILSYANEHDDWMRANQALSYLPEEASAVATIRECFLEHVILDALTPENRQYLLQLQGF
jgi:hypothetical protein